MRLKYPVLVSFIVLVFFSTSVFAQISHGGQPYFKQLAKTMKFELVVMPEISIQNVKSERADGMVSRLKHAKFAHEFKLANTPQNSGTWTVLNTGQRIWNLVISSPGAYSLNLLFEKFRLPKGGKLFVYNDYSDRVLGAYTEKNNKASGRFAVEPLAGDELVIEYIEPLNPEFEAEIELGRVYHDYKNIFRKLYSKGGSTKSTSGDCNVNINCAEGFEWQVEKHAVCHITYRGWIASGALINNTRLDGRPYILTAHHVISKEADAELAIFYFNYEAETCDGTTGAKSQSISGSTLRATTDGLDFTLLEMSSIPPAIYQPYYAGWDRTGDVPSKTVCIHHPNGDVKKISMDYDSPITYSYTDADYTFDKNTHWRVLNWELGTTEGGSSGSPLFDTQHRIIGDLTGGDASCSNSVDDYYAKFSASWDSYPAKEKQLKYWLDPDNTGVLAMDGYNPSIKTDKSIVCVNADVEVSFDFGGDYDTYLWEFGPDATPSTATSKGPHTVTYSQSGLKPISLVYTKGDLTEKEFSNVTIIDEAVPDFTYHFKERSFNFENVSKYGISYLWDFGDGERSEAQNPEHSYDRSGKYQVKLVATNVCGDREVTKTVNTSYNSEVVIYPNPSRNVKTIVDLNAVLYTNLNWWLYDSRGAERLSGYVPQYNSYIELDLRAFPAGFYVLKMDIDGSIVNRKIVVL